MIAYQDRTLDETASRLSLARVALVLCKAIGASDVQSALIVQQGGLKILDLPWVSLPPC